MENCVFIKFSLLPLVYSFWSYKDGDERVQARKTAFEDEVLKKACKFLFQYYILAPSHVSMIIHVLFTSAYSGCPLYNDQKLPSASNKHLTMEIMK